MLGIGSLCHLFFRANNHASQVSLGTVFRTAWLGTRLCGTLGDVLVKIDVVFEQLELVGYPDAQKIICRSFQAECNNSGICAIRHNEHAIQA